MGQPRTAYRGEAHVSRGDELSAASASIRAVLSIFLRSFGSPMMLTDHRQLGALRANRELKGDRPSIKEAEALPS
jgi:hypothetical protein